MGGEKAPVLRLMSPFEPNNTMNNNTMNKSFATQNIFSLLEGTKTNSIANNSQTSLLPSPNTRLSERNFLLSNKNKAQYRSDMDSYKELMGNWPPNEQSYTSNGSVFGVQGGGIPRNVQQQQQQQGQQHYMQAPTTIFPTLSYGQNNSPYATASPSRGHVSQQPHFQHQQVGNVQFAPSSSAQQVRVNQLQGGVSHPYASPYSSSSYSSPAQLPYASIPTHINMGTGGQQNQNGTGRPPTNGAANRSSLQNGAQLNRNPSTSSVAQPTGTAPAVSSSTQAPSQNPQGQPEPHRVNLFSRVEAQERQNASTQRVAMPPPQNKQGQKRPADEMPTGDAQAQKRQATATSSVQAYNTPTTTQRPIATNKVSAEILKQQQIYENQLREYHRLLKEDREEKERRVKRKDELKHDRSALYRHYIEYMEYFPCRSGERLNPYLSGLLANRRMPPEKDSELGRAITYAKENWEMYMEYPKDVERALKLGKVA